MPKSITSCCLPRAFANDWTTTTRAFAICLCYCICWPPTPLRGIEGGKWGTLYSRETGGIYLYISLVTQSCPTLSNPMEWSMPGFPVHHQLPEHTQTHIHWVGDAIQPSHPRRPLLLLPSIFPSIWVFSNESILHNRWSKYWSFSFSISPSNDYSVLISFRMNWLYLLAVQGTFKSLLQYHSSKASILWCSAFCIVQLSHLYMITGNTIALTRWTFVGKGISAV